MQRQQRNGGISGHFLPFYQNPSAPDCCPLVLGWGEPSIQSQLPQCRFSKINPVLWRALRGGAGLVPGAGCGTWTRALLHLLGCTWLGQYRRLWNSKWHSHFPWKNEESVTYVLAIMQCTLSPVS
ncbi:hypothetical protein AV530_015288 [Patagioenas fasciata monilis]|uniref:Uncharacterized protein n=1 Tax=Patagioenas fasciata monilis TaxID=372326 RepID=A0A1V4K1V1_PATFA|nr:hypothetical protein AV530_015288 [Patagioenas fasciata monilis]